MGEGGGGGGGGGGEGCTKNHECTHVTTSYWINSPKSGLVKTRPVAPPQLNERAELVIVYVEMQVYDIS